MTEVSQLSVLIVDDEPVARERMCRLLAGAGVANIAQADDGTSAIQAIRESRPDLVFLDVQMPGVDGFGVLDAIGPADMPLVTFVTAYEEHATRAFDAEAIDYLVKPYADDRFLASFARALRRLRGERSQTVVTPMDRIVIRRGTTVRLIPAGEIAWVEADGIYARFHFAGESHLVRITLHELETRLDPLRFARVHRSAIVNLDAVRELREVGRSDLEIILHDGTRVKLSRARRLALERRLGQSL